MAIRLTLRAESPEGPVERSFTQTPVFIGRKAGEGQFDIEDKRASKLHASLEVHQGQLFLRDAASTNGTVWNGARIAPNEWTHVGPVGSTVSFRIGGTEVTAWTTDEPEVDSRASISRRSVLSVSDPGYDTSQVGRNTTKPRPMSDKETAARGSGPFDAEASSVRLTAACHDASTASLTLERLLRVELDDAPPAERVKLCQQILAEHPELTRNRRVTALFEHYGVNVDAYRDPPGRVIGAAFDALEEIAVWYTGESRRFQEPEHVEEFHFRLRTALDDLMLGYSQLLSGLNRFENQMSIQRTMGPSVTPKSASELASRLLDWQTDNAPVRAQLRASFAELTMHQVAVLRGVMQGVRTLLAELAPDAIEQVAEAESSQQGAVRRMFVKPDPWGVYRRRHSDLSDEENERFRLLFGADFVSEYRQFKREALAEGDAGPARDPG